VKSHQKKCFKILFGVINAILIYAKIVMRTIYNEDISVILKEKIILYNLDIKLIKS